MKYIVILFSIFLCACSFGSADNWSEHEIGKTGFRVTVPAGFSTDYSSSMLKSGGIYHRFYSTNADDSITINIAITEYPEAPDTSDFYIPLNCNSSIENAPDFSKVSEQVTNVAGIKTKLVSCKSNEFEFVVISVLKHRFHFTAGAANTLGSKPIDLSKFISGITFNEQ